MPEGVLADGQRVEGFMYFEKIGDRATRVRLQNELVNADTGELITTASIPFFVDK